MPMHQSSQNAIPGGLNAYCMQTRPLFLHTSGLSGVLKAFLLERDGQLSCTPKNSKNCNYRFHAGPDMALMQQYMHMAASQMDPAALHMAQMAQFAPAHGLNFPPFGVFPPPGMAEQVMAAYGAGFPPFPQDAMAVAQQQAALAAAIFAQQQHQQSQQPPEMLQQAAAAVCTLNQAYQAAAPSQPAPDHRSDHHHGLPSSSQDQQQQQRHQQQQQQRHQQQQQQQQQQGGMRRQHQAEKPAESSCADRQQGMPLLSARAPVKDDPAFGHGKLYKPQASHAKASVPPPSTKFGGAMTDNFQSASTLSRKSSSESVVPPVSRASEGAVVQTLPVRQDIVAAGVAADGVAPTCVL